MPAPLSVYSVVGDRYVILVTGEQTAGAYSVIEMHVPPDHGPPPHVHHREDEAFYVVDGEFAFTVAGEQIRVGKGGFLFAKRDVSHSFKNVGDTLGTLIVTVTPAGLDRFFAEVGTPLANRESAPVPPSPEDLAKLGETAPKYGMELLV